MKPPSTDERSPAVVAYAWASRLTTVSLEMVLPGLGGYWLDLRLGTPPLLTVIGFACGLALGMWHLLKMTSAEQKSHVGNNSDGSEMDKRNSGAPPRDS